MKFKGNNKILETSFQKKKNALPYELKLKLMPITCQKLGKWQFKAINIVKCQKKTEHAPKTGGAIMLEYKRSIQERYISIHYNSQKELWRRSCT